MKIRPLNASFATVIIRFYIMMAVIIGAFFLKVPWLGFLALPIFFSALVGVEFKMKGNTAGETNPVDSKHIKLHKHAA